MHKILLKIPQAQCFIYNQLESDIYYKIENNQVFISKNQDQGYASVSQIEQIQAHVQSFCQNELPLIYKRKILT